MSVAERNVPQLPDNVDASDAISDRLRLIYQLVYRMTGHGRIVVFSALPAKPHCTFWFFPLGHLIFCFLLSGTWNRRITRATGSWLLIVFFTWWVFWSRARSSQRPFSICRVLTSILTVVQPQAACFQWREFEERDGTTCWLTAATEPCSVGANVRFCLARL